MLNPRQMIHFQAAARHGNLRRAAVELGISQPALSKSIHALEARLGVELLTRSTRGVETTAIGKALSAHGEVVAAELLAAEATLEQMRGGGAQSIRIGAGPTFADWLLPMAINRFRQRHPAIRVSVTVGLREQLLHALKTGSIDFFLGSAFESDTKGLRHEVLYSDRLAVCCRPGHPLSGRRTIELAELVEYDWAFIRLQKGGLAQEELLRALLAHGVKSPRTALESDSATLVFATVSQTDTLCLRPIPLGYRLHSIGGLVELSVPPIFQRQTRGLTYRVPSGLTAADRAMVRALKEITADFRLVDDAEP